MNKQIYIKTITACMRGPECPVADRCWRADVRGDMHRFVARHQDGGGQ